jgi:hypothetical protein
VATRPDTTASRLSVKAMSAATERGALELVREHAATGSRRRHSRVINPDDFAPLRLSVLTAMSITLGRAVRALRLTQRLFAVEREVNGVVASGGARRRPRRTRIGPPVGVAQRRAEITGPLLAMPKNQLLGFGIQIAFSSPTRRPLYMPDLHADRVSLIEDGTCRLPGGKGYSSYEVRGQNPIRSVSLGSRGGLGVGLPMTPEAAVSGYAHVKPR